MVVFVRAEECSAVLVLCLAINIRERWRIERLVSDGSALLTCIERRISYSVALRLREKA